MTQFKPLLAETPKLEELRFPLIASPKLDGFRCCILRDGTPVTRNLKPIPNGYIQAKLEEQGLSCVDGELLTYTGKKLDNFNTVQSKVTTRTGMPDFVLHLFDDFTHPSWGYVAREKLLKDRVRPTNRIELLPSQVVNNLGELMALEQLYVDQQGYEGVMLRDPTGIYKFGRSTVKEGILLKVKRFFDAEGEVVGVKELLHNANEAKVNALGYTERSSHKANKQGTGVLGALEVSWQNVQFDLGTGFDFAQREAYWQENLIGRNVVFKYQKLGPNGKPTFPVFKGFRHSSDN